MADSDDDFESNHRGHSRNKFRNERDDLMSSSSVSVASQQQPPPHFPSSNNSSLDKDFLGSGGGGMGRKRERFNNEDEFHSRNNRPPISHLNHQYPNNYNNNYSNGNVRNKRNDNRGPSFSSQPLPPPPSASHYHNYPTSNRVNTPPTLGGPPVSDYGRDYHYPPHNHHHHSQPSYGTGGGYYDDPSGPYPPPPHYHYDSAKRKNYDSYNHPRSNRYNNEYDYYDDINVTKKRRKDWDLFDGAATSSTGYYEHDNRGEPTYSADYDLNEQDPSLAHYPLYNKPIHPQPQASIAGSNGPPIYSSNYQNGFNNNHYHSMQSNYVQDGLLMNPPAHNSIQNINNFAIETQPQMISFKQFLQNLNSSGKGGVSNEQANKLYNEYKNKFRMEQIASFFAAHKHEEWFKCRYHPEDSSKRKDEQRKSIKKRLSLFFSLLEKYTVLNNASISLEMSNDEMVNKLSYFLDGFLVKLEEGSDEDLQRLDNFYANKKKTTAKIENGVEENGSKTEATSETPVDTKEEKEEDKVVVKEEDELIKTEKIIPEKIEEEVKEEEEENKRDEEVVINNEEKKVEELTQAPAVVAAIVEKPKEVEREEDLLPHKTKSIFFKHLPVIVNRQDLEKIGSQFEGFKRASISEPAPERRFQRRGWITFAPTVNIQDICNRINGMKLYDMKLNPSVNREIDQKLKNISGLANHNEIVRNDLKLICKVVENMDRRWRLWEPKPAETAVENSSGKSSSGKEKKEGEGEGEVVEVEQEKSEKNGLEDVEEAIIKNDQLTMLVEDCEQGIKNPLLVEAIEYLNTLSALEPVQEKEETEKPIEEVKSQEEKGEEIKKEEVEEEKKVTEVEKEKVAEETTENTKNLTMETNEDEGLIKGGVDEELEIGLAETTDIKTDTENLSIKKEEGDTNKPATETITTIKIANKLVNLEIDERATHLLDKLILYLRLVHSIDYYNATEYQQEDLMPNKCGVLHVRGSSQAKGDSSSITQVVNGAGLSSFDPCNIKRMQVDEWLRLFSTHIKSYVDYHEHIDVEQAKRLGLKDEKEEVDKFMKDNCKQVDKNVWLCPLSGKKFKGPDYVRKHIESKHGHKVVELKKDIEYFNNFVLDPKRPYLPEHPLSKAKVYQPNTSHQMQYQQSNMYPQNNNNNNFYNNNYGYNNSNPKMNNNNGYRNNHNNNYNNNSMSSQYHHYSNYDNSSNYGGYSKMYGEYQHFNNNFNYTNNNGGGMKR